ncbi:hypothetical protein H6F44_14280 [Pseudanabaena sp. FACHB-1277]|jgi:hypothetical protein|uniref:Uncharacterized protein n=1 Tax=Pseudanabaena cinerea FACHB-1277 TaxID=2949581 RepID=A0A926Z6L4_9CYAN|nr:hypothetical protein [Pseudanabaena cinerea]MBD2151281.1 hypothetical protein [Pseudanabaena cinerea FACHB-1277]
MIFSTQFTKPDVKQPAQTMLTGIIAIAAAGTSAIFADTAQANVSIIIRLGDRPVNTRYHSAPIYKNPYQKRTIYNPHYRSNRGDYSRQVIIRENRVNYDSHKSWNTYNQFPYPVNVPAVNGALNPYYRTPQTSSYIIIR